MIEKKYNQPPYQYLDGGDGEETPDLSAKAQAGKKEQGGATHAVVLPRIIPIGYTDPETGEKTVTELDISKEDPQRLITDIQKGRFMDKRIGDERKKYKTLESKMGTFEEQLKILAAQRGSSVEDEVKRILDDRNKGDEPIVNIDAIADGDTSSMVKALKYERTRREKLEQAFADKLQKDQAKEDLAKDQADTYEKVNIAIGETLAEYPNLKENEFIAEVKNLKLVMDPDGIRALGNLMNRFVKSGVTFDKLPKEEQEKERAKIKAELEAPPPPTPGGEPGKVEPKIKETPVTMESLEKKAAILRKTYFSGS